MPVALYPRQRSLSRGSCPTNSHYVSEVQAVPYGSRTPRTPAIFQAMVVNVKINLRLLSARIPYTGGARTILK